LSAGTVLLVDDAPEIREVLTACLTDEGFAVTAYEAAEPALAQTDRAVPDLVVLDGRLARMSGWQCLEHLHASEQALRLPVLLLTAAIDDLDRAKQAADDCTRYLAKPFDIDELLATIYAVLAACDEPRTVQ